MSKLLDGILGPRALDLLAKLKIYTLDDFLRADVDKLVGAGLQPDELMRLRVDCTKLLLPAVVKGDDYYQWQLKKNSIMQTKISGLDQLLEGGLRMGTLLEICGSSGSGKTQLCLNIAVKLAAEYKIEVLYIDTKGDFVASHLASLVEDSEIQKDFDVILEQRLKIVKARSLQAVITILHHLQDSPKVRKRIKVIIVDSLASLYFPFIGTKTNNGLSLLNHIASLLKKLAVTHCLSVVLVNLASRWSQEGEFEGDFGDDEFKSLKEADEPLKPAMGKYWTHVPNTRLILSRDHHDSKTRTLTVHKSEYLDIGKVTTIEISSNGSIE